MTKKIPFVILMLALLVSGCTGGFGTPITDKDGEVIITTVEVPDIPASLTDDEVSGSSIWQSNYGEGWGEYKIIPQITMNYNEWLDHSIDELINQMLAIGVEDTEFVIEGNQTTVSYENLNKAATPYDIKLTFRLAESDDIQAVFYRNNSGSELRLIIKDSTYHVERNGRTEQEIRELIFADKGSYSHAIALYFRRDAMSNDEPSDMNDIVEIRDYGTEKQVKCVRVYGLTKPWDEKAVMHFASVVDLSDTMFPTTGSLARKVGDNMQPISDSPAIFNNVDKFVQALNEGEEFLGYPSVSSVLSVYNQGVDHQVVQNAEIDPTTLESNLFSLTRN